MLRLRATKTLDLIGKEGNRVLGHREAVLDVLNLVGHVCTVSYDHLDGQILFFRSFTFARTILIHETCGAISRFNKELTDAPDP